MSYMKRAVITERVLTELSRRRELDETESRSLEAAIVDQDQPHRDRLGRAKPRRYFGGFER